MLILAPSMTKYLTILIQPFSAASDREKKKRLPEIKHDVPQQIVLGCILNKSVKHNWITAKTNWLFESWTLVADKLKKQWLCNI